MNRALATLALLVLPVTSGCATQADINQAMTDDLRHTGGVIGFAIDADLEVLTLKAAILRAFQGDPRQKALEEELGTVAEVEAKLERVRAAKRSLLEENKKLRDRYRPEEDQ